MKNGNEEIHALDGASFYALNDGTKNFYIVLADASLAGFLGF